MDPERLRGSRTGVYAGISNNEYRNLILEVSDTAEPAASLYTVTGTSFNTAIGRVAFALGLEGPAMAVDTACSSSLVAMHQAVTGLQRGESDLALAGGVHTILSGRLLELRANAGMLSPQGRCATFDAAANGYVRGEGCGIVVLKRLAEAQADGDRIWGVIRGTALNQDGASPGLTVPSGPAQGEVHRGGARARRNRARAGGLPGSARHRNSGRRPHRARGDGGGIRPGTRAGEAPADRLGQDQHRAPGVGGGRRGRHQDDPGHEARGHPKAPALPDAEPRDGLGPAAPAGDGRADGLAAPRRPSPPPPG